MIEKGQKILESRPVSTGMFLFGLILFGAISYVKNPISLFPNTTYPGLTVSIEYPGADVKDLEEMITIPIEESISGVGGIEEIYSFTERGKTEINVEFEKESNLEFKSLEVRERIDIVAGNFPREVHKPFIYSYDPDNRPTMILTLKSETFDFIELRTIADNEVKRYLENIEGISKISVTGGKVREVLVSCDMQKLRAYGLDLSEIQRSIRENNTTSAVANLKNKD